ncbi:MAG TPA: hypothetical protein VF066_12800 [Thermoleophilaceae bacterium]
MPKAGAVTIKTQKPFGPSAGTFASTGAIPESGTLLNSSVIFERVNAPEVVTVHLTQRFNGALGTFTLRAAITETATADPNVLADDGTWAIIAGTGAYETLQGGGRVTGIADDNLDLISRTYSGTVRRG